MNGDAEAAARRRWVAVTAPENQPWRQVIFLPPDLPPPDDDDPEAPGAD